MCVKFWVPTRSSRVQSPAWSMVELWVTHFCHTICRPGHEATGLVSSGLARILNHWTMYLLWTARLLKSPMANIWIILHIFYTYNCLYFQILFFFLSILSSGHRGCHHSMPGHLRSFSQHRRELTQSDRKYVRNGQALSPALSSPPISPGNREKEMNYSMIRTARLHV